MICAATGRSRHNDAAAHARERALVQQHMAAITDDVAKRKVIKRSKRAPKERIDNGYDQGRPPFGLTFDDNGHYWISDRDSDEFQQALAWWFHRR